MTADTRPPVDLEERAAARLPAPARSRFERIDRALSGLAAEYGVTLLRLALGLVFIWFGALKVVDRSPVEDLVADTLDILPRDLAVYGMGALELVIGVGLLVPVALRLTLALFWAQMLGTVATFLIEPGRAFEDGNPLLLSQEGEFIVKNLVLITAGIVIASTVHHRTRARRAAGEAPRSAYVPPSA